MKAITLPIGARFLVAAAFTAVCMAARLAPAGTLNAVFNSPSDVPVTANGYMATSNSVNLTLNFAPPAGTDLMLVSNTALDFIQGTFNNLAQGQLVALSYGGVTFPFVPNYYGGSGNDLLSYDGENLARHHDAVVVTHNHRLNLFGYLNLAEIGGERYASSGNVGMLDIVAVLEWVRDNIANFGGDPGNVLVYGQSGGGGKVSTLMAMPAAKGLFHRAVVQSGSGLRSGSADAAAKLATAVLAELGISKTQLDKLAAVSARTLCSVQADAARRLREGAAAGTGVGLLVGWGPVLDGRIIPAHPFDPGAPAISADVPMLIGTCLNEMVNGTDNPDRESLTDADLAKRVADRYKDQGADIIAAYRKEYPKESPFGLWAAISAAGVRQNAITQAERKAAQGAAPAFMYMYAWRTPMLGGKIGTFHSSEITFAFANASLCLNYSGGGPEALALSGKMGGAWASFARTGKPGHAGLPAWPSYTEKTRATMVFDTASAIRNDPESAGLRLIRKAS